MTKRLLIGWHAGFQQWGVWLSKPGYDVTVPGDSTNFLLRPDYRYEQILFSGAVSIDPRAMVMQIAFPLALDIVPDIRIYATYNATVTEYPAASASGQQSGNVSGDSCVSLRRYPMDNIATLNLSLIANNPASSYAYAWYMVYNRPQS